MNDDQLLRYSRHILLPQLGIEGQERRRGARAGGERRRLGSLAAMYLASAGGHHRPCDGDTVDLTNLQRQILHHTNSVGKPKALSGRDTLTLVNPEVEVIALEQRLEGAALEEQVAAADVVLDCSDNFATRHAINRACVKHRKPLVSGAAIRFDGQVSVFDLREPQGPCYNCLFAEDQEAEEVRCAVMGVFAPLTGIIGTMQAAEALKLIAGCGESLSGRLLLLDGLAMEWRSIQLGKDPGCAVCGKGAE